MAKRKQNRTAGGPISGPSLSVEQAFRLAMQKMRAGELHQADEACVKVLGADPFHLGALQMRGVLAFRLGQTQRGIEILEYVVKLNPAHVQAQNDLGMMLHSLGKYSRAEAHLNVALEHSPKMALAHLNLGNVLRSTGRLTEAEKHYRRAIRLKPELVDAYGNLSLVQFQLGRPTDAENSARKGIKVKPEYGLLHSRLASALDRQGRLEEALSEHNKAIELQPGVVSAHLDLAYSLIGNGRIEQAEARYREALKLDPENVRTLGALARIKKFTSYDDDIKVMENLFERKTLPEPGQMVLAFSLAKAFEDIGEFSRAFDCLQQGNSLNRKTYTYSKTATETLFSNIRQAFGPETFSRFSEAGALEETPLFIVGMPRSGTSLVEQIVSSHPDVTGAGELSLMNSLSAQFVRDPTNPDFCEAVEGADVEQFTGLGGDYLRALRLYSSDARFITDKMPGNMLYVGLIKLMLPNAKIIHCRRDPVDTCLSVYKNYFSSGGLSFAYDLGELGHYYREYESLMAHWHQVLPGFVYDLTYEELIADQRGQTQKLLEWCELDWSEDCMNFFQAKRLVNTASIVQVRQPVYKSSISLWKKYGSALNPLLEALGKTA